MHLFTAINLAKKNQSRTDSYGGSLLRASISGEPDYRMTNALAAFRAEMEDLLARPLEIVGGGAGCVHISLHLGHLSETQIDGLNEFIRDDKNREYFKQRYGVSGLSLVL